MDTFTIIWSIICGLLVLTALGALAYVIYNHRRLEKRGKQLSIDLKHNELDMAEALCYQITDPTMQEESLQRIRNARSKFDQLTNRRTMVI